MSYKIMKTADLLFGVSRPPSFWDEHPDFVKEYKKVRESVKTDGLHKPLEVRKTNEGYVVEVGNQRLQALLDLGITTAPCFIKGE